MLKRIVRGLLTLMGVGMGVGIALAANWILDGFNISIIPQYQTPALLVVFGLIFGIIVFITSFRIMNVTISCLRWIERKLSEIPVHDMFFGSLGLIIGLFIAFLMSDPIRNIGLRWV